MFNVKLFNTCFCYLFHKPLGFVVLNCAAINLSISEGRDRRIHKEKYREREGMESAKERQRGDGTLKHGILLHFCHAETLILFLSLLLAFLLLLFFLSSNRN